jgi:hypothetical protein
LRGHLRVSWILFLFSRVPVPVSIVSLMYATSNGICSIFQLPVEDSKEKLWVSSEVISCSKRSWKNTSFTGIIWGETQKFLVSIRAPVEENMLRNTSTLCTNQKLKEYVVFSSFRAIFQNFGISHALT